MITLLDSEVGAIRKYSDRLSGKIIDLGGGATTFENATTVVDLNECERQDVRLVRGDLCAPNTYAQFQDKEFDGAWCNHTLEDLYDPFIVLRQIQRIAKRGLIGVPHWTREITVQDVRSDWEHICGWPHHFWLVGINRETGVLEFYPKQSWLVYGERPWTTANINLEWDGGELPYKNIYHEYNDLMRRDRLVAWLESRWLTE